MPQATAASFSSSGMLRSIVERLRGREVIVAGERAADMAVRLRYAEVDHRIAPSLDAALADGQRRGADVLATYTAFWQVKGALARAVP